MKNKIDKIKPETNLPLEEFENTLRPKTFTDFLGQKDIIANLSVFIQAAKQRGEPLDHILFYGPPGIGKTTLAHVIAHEYGSDIKITSGPAIERAGDLASILTNLSDGDILFIDEIHRLNKTVEEVLYPAVEDFALDIILGKGPSARTVRLDLPKFTLVGATTKFGMISNPLRDRFGAIFRLSYYLPEDLTKIIRRSSKILGISIDNAVAEIISKRSRGTPRIANRLLKRIRDYSEVEGIGVTKSYAEEILDKLGINRHGLDKEDIKYIKAIKDRFGGGPVGLSTLAAALSEDKETIEEVIEPFLIQSGIIKRTGKGRMLTDLVLDNLLVF